ncbi:hypothetical protein BKI52_29485 [marine bacterium AO1-C]|nr:hypothetical protein BKI52_29485 [marine bacterium AO1-C]
MLFIQSLFNLSDVISRTMKSLILSSIFCGLAVSLIAQNNQPLKNNLQLQVREDMLNLKAKGLKKDQVYSASRELEQLVNAPVSATVITQKMIAQTGVINIAEALRLAPGVLVQQKTNGNYEVHLRHSQSFATQGSLQDTKNQQLLVLIDHVPQYDYLFGGILWESLPVDLHDIERIEVIRTPSVVFFGNTAVTGVIHIFTKHPEDNDLKLFLQSQAGNNLQNLGSDAPNLSAISRAALSFGVSDKLRFRLSGHYHFLHRFQEDYHLLNENRHISSDSLLFYKQNAPQTNLNTRLAQENLGVNALISYKPSAKAFFSTHFTYQASHIQTVQGDDTLALIQRQVNTLGVNLNAHIDGFHLNASQSLGMQNYALAYNGNQFENNQSQASLSYQLSLQKIQLQPGVGFLHTENTAIAEANETTLPTNRLVGYYAFTKADMNLTPQWRIMGSVRGDQYEGATRPYLSYQMSSSLKINQHFLRGNYTYNEGIPLVRSLQQSIAHSFLASLNPNKVTTIELGWNARIASKINTSLEVFQSQFTLGIPAFSQVASSPSGTSQKLQHSFVQVGSSARVQVWLNKLQIDGFMTIQQSANSWEQLRSEPAKHTARLYGGVQLNYVGFLGKLNANAQIHYYDKYQFNTQYGHIEIPTRTLLNMKISYKIWREHMLFFNARNLLNTNQREYAFADNVTGFYLLGLQINI